VSLGLEGLSSLLDGIGRSDLGPLLPVLLGNVLAELLFDINKKKPIRMMKGKC
jgi:hypothetical protein